MRPIIPNLRKNGIFLALLGATILAPDSLLMRLSGLSGPNMLFWRGLCSGIVYIGVWVFFEKPHLRQILRPFSASIFWFLIAFQVVNGAGFTIGIANAPVSSVLLGVATMPLMAAVLSAIFLNEKLTLRLTVTIGFVLAGLTLAMANKDGGALALDRSTAFGALCGLAVAISLAANFVIVRKNRDLPFPLGMGLGAILAGLLGLWMTQTTPFADLGSVLIIAVTGAVIVPCSLFLLTLSSRYTSASNVSLIMLLETILGPIWVWAFLGESPTSFMLAGGSLVVTTLVFYLRNSGTIKPRL